MQTLCIWRIFRKRNRTTRLHWRLKSKHTDNLNMCTLSLITPQIGSVESGWISAINSYTTNLLNWFHCSSLKINSLKTRKSFCLIKIHMNHVLMTWKLPKGPIINSNQKLDSIYLICIWMLNMCEYKVKWMTFRKKKTFKLLELYWRENCLKMFITCRYYTFYLK